MNKSATEVVSKSVTPSPICTIVFIPFSFLRCSITFALPPFAAVGWSSSKPAYSPANDYFIKYLSMLYQIVLTPVQINSNLCNRI